MAAAAGIFNHAITAGQALTGKTVTPMTDSTSGANGSSSSDDTSSSSSTISANDFLTLLVTEMQNQDPTADTDPNEYIDQLVQVNSLEQLIDINQTLSTDLGSTSTGTGAGASAQAAQTTPGIAGANLTGSGATSAATAMNNRTQALSMSQSGTTTGSAAVAPGSATVLAPGNLSVPGVNPAAERVAHALYGRTRPNAGSVSAAQ